MKLLLILAIFGLLSCVGISTTLVDIPTFDGSYLELITLKGDAFQAHGGITMDNLKSKYGTKQSTGALFLKNPISSQDLTTFQTEFTFMSTKPGSGFTFFLSPSSDAGLPGFFFRLPSRFIAIVFDNSIKVLIDNGALFAETEGNIHALNNGIIYTVWLVFAGKISIYISDSKLRPMEPVLECNSFAVKAFIEEFEKLYIGFSSASMASEDRYKLYNWKLEVNEIDIPTLKQDFTQILVGVLGILLMIVIFLGIMYIFARNRRIIPPRHGTVIMKGYSNLEEDGEPSYGPVIIKDVLPTSNIELMKNVPPEQGEVWGLAMEDMWMNKGDIGKITET